MKKIITILCFLLLYIGSILYVIPNSIEYIYTVYQSVHKSFYTYYITHTVKKYCAFYNRNYSDETIQTIVTALYIGSTYYNIDYKKIATIIAVESRYNIYAINKNYNNTFDYGLTQQNSNYIQQRYEKAKQICNIYNIPYKHSLYDITLNILSAYIYMNDIQKHIKCEKQQIIAYNTGIKGSFTLLRKKDIYSIPYYTKYTELLSI